MQAVVDSVAKLGKVDTGTIHLNSRVSTIAIVENGTASAAAPTISNRSAPTASTSSVVLVTTADGRQISAKAAIVRCSRCWKRIECVVQGWFRPPLKQPNV
jgi:hypothetical protein